MKRLLILGNGYHIANNYKTSYGNFKDFLCKSEEYFKILNRNGHIRDDSREYWHPGKIDMINANDLNEYFFETANIAEANYFDISYINKFKQAKLYKMLINTNYDLWSDVEEGIKLTINWYLNNQDWIKSIEAKKASLV